MGVAYVSSFIYPNYKQKIKPSNRQQNRTFRKSHRFLVGLVPEAVTSLQPEELVSDNTGEGRSHEPVLDGSFC